MLDRDAILGAFERLAALLRERGVEGEVCLLDGTVMVLAFRSRPATKDVDAIFQPTSLVRELARTVAAERELPEDSGQRRRRLGSCPAASGLPS
jgi:hypothetical protein